WSEGGVGFGRRCRRSGFGGGGCFTALWGATGRLLITLRTPVPAPLSSAGRARAGSLFTVPFRVAVAALTLTWMFWPLSADSALMRFWISVAISWSLRGAGAGAAAGGGGARGGSFGAGGNWFSPHATRRR